MKTIDITTVLSPDLKSRSTVADLLLYVLNSNEQEIQIDFSRVLFATRSFMDEYYNTFVNDHGKLNGIKVESINLPEDIQYMLNVVSQTQTGKKLYEEPANTTTHRQIHERTDNRRRGAAHSALLPLCYRRARLAEALPRHVRLLRRWHAIRRFVRV